MRGYLPTRVFLVFAYELHGFNRVFYKFEICSKELNFMNILPRSLDMDQSMPTERPSFLDNSVSSAFISGDLLFILEPPEPFFVLSFT